VVVFASSDNHVMSVILRNGTIELNDLKKESGLPERTLRNVVKRLKNRGIVEQQILLSDLRKKVISIKGTQAISIERGRL
jgi:DNA-binding MarR family transcriptional regulator